MSLPPWLQQINPALEVQVNATLVPAITSNGVTIQVLNETVYVGSSGGGGGTVTITGGTIDGAVIGGTTPAAGTFTALTLTSIPLAGAGGTLPAGVTSGSGVIYNNGGALCIA